MHVRRALALTAVVPLLLAGCSDDPEPQPKMPDPPPSSSPTPTTSETVEAESAEEFIRRWVEIDRRMQNSGDIAEYSEVSAKCKTCMSVANRVQRIFAAGGYVETDGLQITQVMDRSSSQQPIFDVTVRSAPTRLKESASAEVENLPGGSVTYRMRLSSTAPWQLVRLTQLAS